MEFKEYLKIIKENRRLFFGIIFATLIFSLAYFQFRPESFDVFLTINITRKGSQNSNEYDFGGFYRLQADERFAETITYWLKSPRVVLDTLKAAGMSENELEKINPAKFFRAEKMSSQIVAVYFSAPDKDRAQKISSSMIKKISQNTEGLNSNQKENDWFEVQAFDPVVKKNEANFFLVLVFSLFGGTFLSFWVVIFRHYIKD